MSQITTAYNALITRLEDLLPNHTRLGDSIDVAENDDLSLRQGFGVAFGPGNRVIASFGSCGKRYQDKVMSLILTRHALAKQDDGATKDATALQLHEDLATVIDDLTLDGTLNDGSSVTDWISDDGIEKIADKESFLALRADFNLRLVDTF